MAAISHTSSASIDHGETSRSLQNETKERVLEKKARVRPWGPALILNNEDIYPILQGKWEANVKLGASIREDSPSRKRLRTDDIPTYQVPLPPLNNFVTVGVVGGMGPEATLDLNKKLFNTAAKVSDPKKDQDHMPVQTFNLPHMIGDRTAYLNSFTGNRDNPDEWRAHLLKPDTNNPYWGALECAKACIDAGAHFLIFPCNTFHAYHGVLSEKLTVPLLHIAEATMWALKKGDMISNTSVALLATDGTIASKLYQNSSKKMESYECPQINWVLPTKESQKYHIMDGIYKGVKKGNFAFGTKQIDEGVNEIALREPVSAMVQGCTEIPIALKDKDYGEIRMIDATQALAEMAVEFSRALARLEKKYA